jgi:cytochrome c oxidase subunit IV
MDNAHVDSVAHDHGHGDGPSFSTAAIWKTFRILLYITIGELILAILYYKTGFIPKHLLNGVFVILTLAKAFYIVAEFMHLRHEIKNLIMTIIVPLLLFVWFLGAFLWDGDSYKNLRNNYDRHHMEQSKTKVESPELKNEVKKEGSKE